MPSGSKTTLVLLRGWMRDQRHWETFPKVLSTTCHEKGLDYKLAMVDIPGNGHRCQEHTPASIPDMYQQLQEELGHSTPLILIGLSMGGMIARQWATQNPGQVHGLVLINSSMRPFARPWERLQPKVWPQLLKHLGKSLREREKLIMELTLSPENRSSERLETWIDWSHKYPISYHNACRQLYAAARYKCPTTAAPACPTLVIGGKNDQLVNPVCSKRMADSWNCDFVQLPGGHDLPVEHPERLARHIVDWLKKLPS
ncbi:hypothetical protein BTA51_15770 [Hahella sp. CCB-MM4]|uniref:alpha/beta fold hydrolase n=1 Tax=Hahella sp. (strain CCB-MM4) TaxID=1926491 RepID=UPI000B9C2792|nr:alpha/beta hydrolase [Hahella sp. CCB-MM4]OZG72567.1 hypothetical protein BTA51_15770 [Hahella sp. CCB-MM4]